MKIRNGINGCKDIPFYSIKYKATLKEKINN